MFNTDASQTHTVLYTAKEFLDRFEPGVADLLLAPETSLEVDTEYAHALASRYELPKSATGHYPRVVWELVYP